jgi:hypothetical protein
MDADVCDLSGLWCALKRAGDQILMSKTALRSSTPFAPATKIQKTIHCKEEVLAPIWSLLIQNLDTELRENKCAENRSVMKHRNCEKNEQQQSRRTTTIKTTVLDQWDDLKHITRTVAIIGHLQHKHGLTETGRATATSENVTVKHLNRKGNIYDIQSPYLSAVPHSNTTPCSAQINTDCVALQGQSNGTRQH